MQAGADTGPAPDDIDPDALLNDITRVLDEFEQRGLLSDQRAADALLHAKAPRYGQRRLKQILQSRALDAELVSSTLQKARSTELERAREVWRRRFGTPATDPHERARQQRFLMGRGFEGAVIDRVLREAGMAPDSDACD